MRNSTNYLLFVLIMIFCLTINVIAKNEIEQINQAIAEKGANWIAGESWVTKLTPDERSKLCGTFLEPIDASQATLLSLPPVDNLPATFDWRNNNGNWVTPVKNQGGCGSCWDFSAVAQVEAWWKIYNTNRDSMIDLSEQFVLSCSNGSCNGWGVGSALEFIKTTGMPTESCFPYQANDGLPCSSACIDWENQAVKIPGWGYITLEEAIVENIKSAVYRHPVSASYTVYEDFNYYSGGVYEHVWGEERGGHAILIVGWNDEEQSWICKNSWGEHWGDDGYFRIKWGNCGIGSNIPFIWDQMTGGSNIAITPQKLNLSLTVGDSTTETVSITNLGANVLDFFSIDYQVAYVFHVDTFNAYDDHSWWCGDPELGGYDDHWLQYLDSPILDLSNTIAPRLTWMGYWAIEDPSGAESPWDGWDGCNVWISTNGGETFNVANPTTPSYNCQSMWSFGHDEQGWNMGVGIAGWSGKSGAWIPVEFDLSNYRSDSVVIRFAFASDLALSTIDEPDLYGFFVDEINVSDGAAVIFENHGVDNGDMRRIGFSISEADWLNITNGAGSLQPNGSDAIHVDIKTGNLAAGKYHGMINIITNDTTIANLEIPLSLELSFPDHDVGIEDIWLPSGNLFILGSNEVGAKIKNYGLDDETDFDLICTIVHQNNPIYQDTVHVAEISAGESKTIRFKSFNTSLIGEVDILIHHSQEDYNPVNNDFIITKNIGNLIDNFEIDSTLWSFDGGWGITDKFKGYDSDRAAHLYKSNREYLNNMDATMTLNSAFNLNLVEKATVKFMAQYITEQDKDICYIEISGDSLNWHKADSLSGAKTWDQHEIEFTDYINSGDEKIWLRFHFISDNQNTMFGVLIDDVEIYAQNPTKIIAQQPTQSIPHQWRLSQNYPNPFNMTTRINYSIPEAGEVSIVIYNTMGQVVRNLLGTYQTPGNYFVDWNGCDDFGDQVGTGIYFYQLEVKGNFSMTKKLILMK